MHRRNSDGTFNLLSALSSRQSVSSAAVLVVGMIGLSISASAPAAPVPAPAWAPIAVTGPTNLSPGGEGTIVVYVQNVGGAASSGPITVEDQLPPGLAIAAALSGKNWACSSPGPAAVACTTTQPVAPGAVASPITIPVAAGAATLEPEVNLLTASGGGAQQATHEEPVTISAAPAKPGVQAFAAGSYQADGSPSVQAGSHPYAWITSVFVNTVAGPHGELVPAGDARTIGIGLPPGFLVNPTATPGCAEGLEDSACPLETQVGIVGTITAFGSTPELNSVHSIEAPFRRPAKFTFSPAGMAQVNLVSGLSSDEDYGIVAELPDAPQIKPIYGAFLTFWGVPADSDHDELRCSDLAIKSNCGPSAADRTALLAQPTGCALQAARPPVVKLDFETWQEAGQFEHRQAPTPPISGCERLAFGASFSFEPPAASESDSPAAFGARLTVPPAGLTDPEGLRAPDVQRAVVELPRGVVLNASVADGLGACSTAQIGLRGTGFPAPNRIRFDKAPSQCPDSAKIGTGELKSALLERTLKGALYLAAQGEGNPFGSLFAFYFVVEDPATGILLKLPGKIAADEQSGQIALSFEDLPQLPFTLLRLDLRGGDRALLATPSTCGEFVTTAAITPWSAPESGPPVATEDSFTVASGPGGGACADLPQQRPFDLRLAAGTTNPTAGAHSPFTLWIARPDGAQEVDTLQLRTPPGFAASLRGVPYCTEAQIEAARASTGAAEQRSSACPSASRVGTTDTGAGSGRSPVHVQGKLYLAGPYKGAPLSVVAVTPALVGPFDLGNLVVRSALEVDPSSAQLTVSTDPIPQFLEGIQLRVRDVRIDLDRRDWARNPTSCEAKRVDVEAHGNSGAIESLSNRFQVGGCDALAFKPKLRLAVAGGTGRNGHPALTATLTQPPGQANVGRVSVALPRSQLLAQSHIRKVCTRAQFDRAACPARSVYGRAEVETPLLDEPLTGPVYLRSSDHKLPDLVIALSGPPRQPIEIDLVGRVDSSGGRIRVSLGSIPDVSVSRFVLRMQGGRKALLVNSRDMCRGTHRAGVRLVGQNGKRRDLSPTVRVRCGKEHTPTALGHLHR